MRMEYRRKLLNLLPVLAVGWIPAAPASDSTGPDFSEYVYLHMTRGAASPPAGSCPGKAQVIRS
jgi:hypothetical protein